MISYWLVELAPAFEGHPPYPTTYYAGYIKDHEAATTQDPNRAARFLYRYDAAVVAASLLPTKSCVWIEREHLFYDRSDDPDSFGTDDIPSC